MLYSSDGYAIFVLFEFGVEALVVDFFHVEYVYWALPVVATP